MQIKIHVTLQELKDFYLANTEGLPKDAELVVDEPVKIIGSSIPVVPPLHYHNGYLRSLL